MTRRDPWPASESRKGDGRGLIAARRREIGFTLIELLVVISIIGLLATLTVGLTGVASRKSKESRVEGDLNRLVTAIENYRAALGSYPRDNPGKPSTNQLFYELSGTYFENGVFRLVSGAEQMRSDQVQAVFNAPGFGNSVRPGDKLKVTHEFKGNQFKEISRNPDVEVLVVPVKGPQLTTIADRQNRPQQIQLEITATDNTKVNPWMYDSSSAYRNNRQGFDLWADVMIGSKVMRFSNWDKPTVIGQVR